MFKYPIFRILVLLLSFSLWHLVFFVVQIRSIYRLQYVSQNQGNSMIVKECVSSVRCFLCLCVETDIKELWLLGAP